MAGKYNYYMSRLVDGAWSAYAELETRYQGMKFMKATNLNNYGKVKNIYTESYPEADELRVYLPSTPVRENTTIELQFAFEGSDRRNVYDSFVEWMTGYRLKYYDTVRYREAEMILVDAVEVEDEELYGSAPNFVVTFVFTNVKGYTTKRNDYEIGGVIPAG